MVSSALKRKSIVDTLGRAAEVAQEYVSIYYDFCAVLLRNMLDGPLFISHSDFDSQNMLVG